MINDDPYIAMQAAVDIVGTSTHPTNKIAATLFHKTFSISRTNYWPEPILAAFGMDTRIGNSSGSVHSEVATLLECKFPTNGARLAVTDPPCPNCVKNLADAGIKEIYIDHKGFDKDWAQRRGGHFQNMSMQICEKAGINVHILYRKDKRVETVFHVHPSFVPVQDSPITKESVETLNEGAFQAVIEESYTRHIRRKFAVAIMQDAHGRYHALVARGNAVTGFTMEDPEDVKEIEQHQHGPSHKYSLFQEPVNRLLMYRAKRGFKLCDGYFFSSQVPTSREQVNLIGAGMKRLTVGNPAKARDPDALVAMKQLSDAKIIDYR